MLYVGIFFLELLVLFFLSRTLSVELSYFFQRLTGSRRISMFLLALVFLPGTFIHEMSHFLMAKLLLVHTGRISLWPQMETAKSVTMGTVEVAKVDLVRNFLVGIAPFIVGTLLAVQILWFALTHNVYDNRLFVVLIGYALFVIGNTMFSSKKDMEGALLFYLLIGILLAVGYFFGLRIEHILSFVENQKNIVSIMRSAVLLLLIPLIIDIIIIVMAKVLNSIHL